MKLLKLLLLGHFNFNFNSNVERYLKLLQEQLMSVRTAVGMLNHPLFMHDGCSVHNIAMAKNYLE